MHTNKQIVATDFNTQCKIMVVLLNTYFPV